MRQIGEKTKIKIEELGLTVSALSRESGIPRTTIQNILNGASRSPGTEIIVALAATMNCPVKDLLSDDDPRLKKFVMEDEFGPHFLSEHFKVNRMDEMLKIELERVDSILEHFDYTSHFSKYVGKQIAAHGAEDIEFITNLLLEGTLKKEKLFSWTFFDWTNADNLVLVSNYGKLAEPVDLTGKREHMTKVRKEPWKMFVDPPALSIPGDEWIIPAAMGIESEQGEYLGTITLGFNIKALYEKMMSAVVSENVRFVILDSEYRIIVQPLELYTQKRSDFFQDTLKGVALKEKGKLTHKIDYSGIILSNYKKSFNGTFIILAGYSW
ncbi:MAG: helix-turn-helix domain-containing protein [Alphaproteobacteria bacterium]